MSLNDDIGDIKSRLEELDRMQTTIIHNMASGSDKLDKLKSDCDENAISRAEIFRELLTIAHHIATGSIATATWAVTRLTGCSMIEARELIGVILNDK